MKIDILEMADKTFVGFVIEETRLEIAVSMQWPYAFGNAGHVSWLLKRNIISRWSIEFPDKINTDIHDWENEGGQK